MKPLQNELPEGLTSPALEDAEIARLQAAKEAERRARWEAKSEEKGQPDGSEKEPHE